ncbi:MAG TPA: hypothetical protein VHE99_11325 [Gammaproteobacteria bacterium]|nr:hypothetical protein [Gammaproteobacteria bacterium]
MTRPPIAPTEDMKTRIYEAFRVGASLEQAAKYAGISRRTLKRWIDQSKFEKHGKLVSFWQQIEKAKAELIISLLVKINHAATKNWKAAVWKLEHICPSLYGKTTNKDTPAEDDPFDAEEDEI